MKILIAYDDSEHAKAAIDDLQRAGLPADATAMVLSAVDTLLPTAAVASDPIAADGASCRVAATLAQVRAETEQATDEASGIAHEGIRRVRRYFPDWHVFADPVVGAAAQAIVKRAERWPAHLIVLGSHGRSALGRLVLGSVSTHVASHCSRSVRVTRHVIARTAAPVRVVIGLDGSRGAAAAVRGVLSRRWPPGTEVRVVAVHGSNDVADGDMRVMVDYATEMFLAAGFHVSMRIAEGNPRDVLNDEARTSAAHCIFVGARGATTDSPGNRVGLGTVAGALVSSAPCSVEIVR